MKIEQTPNTPTRPTRARCLHLLAMATIAGMASTAGAASPFTPLTATPAPKIVNSSTAYPGGRYNPGNLTDNDIKTEYSSDGKGTSTFVEFEFAAPTRVAAFRHVDRNDPATIASSELILSDASGRVVATVPVKHASTRGGVTFVTLPSAVEAKRVKWHVTGLGPQGHGTVGGAEIGFYAAGAPESSPTRATVRVNAVPVLECKDGGLVQPLRLEINYPYAEPADLLARVEGVTPRSIHATAGGQTVEFSVPEVKAENNLKVSLEFAGKILTGTNALIKPVRQMAVYILPHSHTDIGYTAIQTDIEKKQVNNLIEGIAYARKTASYPEGARFVWNVEVLWAADLYLRRLSEAQRAEFFEAVKKGWVVLNGMYLNELTGLCRPEELLRLFRYSTQLADQCGVTIDSAMISDVPGYTWATVTAMTHAGIKYFSTAPNYFDRIGDILVRWENKPFYWLGPDRQSKLLVWIPLKGYALSHIIDHLTPGFVEDYMAQLEKTDYRYDIAHLRWSGHGDNAVPDPSICEFVKEWNATHAWPRFIISGTSEAFRAFEQKYGSALPVVPGDWTPYWEDGAGSSALETAMNRASSDRLTQAEAVYALLKPSSYPVKTFEDAWNNVLLYSEHTWGAWCSVNGPERKETKEQWKIKKSYADQADKQSRELLERALPGSDASDESVDVFNSTSWPRTDLVVLSKDLSAAGDRVLDDRGTPVPSQRLSGGELAFVPREVPQFSTRRYKIVPGQPHVQDKVEIRKNGLANKQVNFRLDETTGGIMELSAAGLEGNFADTQSSEALNDYLYLPGDNLADLKRNGPVKITVKETGPLVASLLVESEAPGCHKLAREIRLIAGCDYVEIFNTVDKQRLNVKSYMDKQGKESVNFAFPFNVPDGQMTLDLPLGAIRPDQDLLPSACKNWFTVGRWADVSSADRGITWVTLDAPLVQVGGITANLLNSQTDYRVWRNKVERTQKLYSWAMNNHWGTNYRAYQEGPTMFRFILRPHRRFAPDAATRFATGLSQPLLAKKAAGKNVPSQTPRLTVAPLSAVVTALKPSDDGKALIVRLFGASGKNETAKITWANPAPKQIWLSDTSEKPLRRAAENIEVPAWGVVTLRAELP